MQKYGEKPVVTVGQKVAIRSAYGHGDYKFGWTVKKVTATGQVVVESVSKRPDGTSVEYRFDASGKEMGCGASSYHSSLETDVAGAREVMLHKERSIEACRKLGEVSCDHGLRWTWGKESMRGEVKRLSALLTAAQLAVEAIPS